MRLYQTSTQQRLYHKTYPQQEQECILATFNAGYEKCKAALYTFLHALIMFLLVIIHIMTFVINFTIGVLVIFHAIVCMMRLLLVQLQALTENSMNIVERGNKR